MRLTLLLPARQRLAKSGLPNALAAILGRADRKYAETGLDAQLRRQFALLPDPLPVAALTRQHDAGDAGKAAWLRADPAFIQPDLTGARMLGWGQMLTVDARDVAELLPSLQALFKEHGLTLDAPVPARWYVLPPAQAELPDMEAPETVLGEDVAGYLPQGGNGRFWRKLLTESQILLHQHPWNAQRHAQGQRAINTLWFWGAGYLPQAIHSAHAEIHSRDALLLALGAQAGVVAPTTDAGARLPVGSTLIDLRHLRALSQLMEALQPLLIALARRELDALHLDFADGALYHLTSRQRWRFWKRPARWPLTDSAPC